LGHDLDFDDEWIFVWLGWKKYGIEAYRGVLVLLLLGLIERAFLVSGAVRE
jgi:hypothetical protein